MKTIMNAVIYNYELIKMYWKYYLFTIAFCVAVMLYSQSPTMSVFYMMFMLSVSISYGFQIEEKNNLSRLYGMAPVKRNALVTGRYLFHFGLALVVLLIMLLVIPLILRLAGKGAVEEGYWVVGALSYIAFIIIASIQLPAFYKWGSIKGRWVVFLPLIFIFAGSFSLSFLSTAKIAVENASLGMILIPITLVALAMLAGSYFLSVKFFQQKEF